MYWWRRLGNWENCCASRPGGCLREVINFEQTVFRRLLKFCNDGCAVAEYCFNSDGSSGRGGLQCLAGAVGFCRGGSRI